LDNKLNESERDDKNLRLELEELDFDLSIWDIELKSEELFPLKIERIPFVNQEIDMEELGEFECKCPKCWFEFNLDN
jgi:hypothetical protein